jgi:hypothetical protein
VAKLCNVLTYVVQRRARWTSIACGEVETVGKKTGVFRLAELGGKMNEHSDNQDSTLSGRQ